MCPHEDCTDKPFEVVARWGDRGDVTVCPNCGRQQAIHPYQPKPKTLAERIAAAEAKGAGKYGTTATSCGCPDHQYRGRTCKHMLEVRLKSLRGKVVADVEYLVEGRMLTMKFAGGARLIVALDGTEAGKSSVIVEVKDDPVGTVGDGVEGGGGSGDQPRAQDSLEETDAKQ